MDLERILTERRASFAKTYDIVPALGATVKDLKIEQFTISSCCN